MYQENTQYLSRILKSWWWILNESWVWLHDDRITIFRAIFVCSISCCMIEWSEVVPVVRNCCIIITSYTIASECRTYSTSSLGRSSEGIIWCDKSLDIELGLWEIKKDRFFIDKVWSESCTWIISRKYSSLCYQACFDFFYTSFDIDIPSLSEIILKSDKRTWKAKSRRNNIGINIDISSNNNDWSYFVGGIIECCRYSRIFKVFSCRIGCFFIKYSTGNIYWSREIKVAIYLTISSSITRYYLHILSYSIQKSSESCTIDSCSECSTWSIESTKGCHSSDTSSYCCFSYKCGLDWCSLGIKWYPSESIAPSKSCQRHGIRYIPDSRGVWFSMIELHPTSILTPCISREIPWVSYTIDWWYDLGTPHTNVRECRPSYCLEKKYSRKIHWWWSRKAYCLRTRKSCWNIIKWHNSSISS